MEATIVYRFILYIIVSVRSMGVVSLSRRLSPCDPMIQNPPRWQPCATVKWKGDGGLSDKLASSARHMNPNPKA